MPSAELAVRCPKCGAAPGSPCHSLKQGGRIGKWPYEFHKKRITAAILGGPSTESLTVPVRLSVLKTRARVGPVDSALKSLEARLPMPLADFGRGVTARLTCGHWVALARWWQWRASGWPRRRHEIRRRVRCPQCGYRRTVEQRWSRDSTGVPVKV